MSENQTHLIVDIETLSTKPNAVVLSLGCVSFQFETKKMFSEYLENGFYVKLDIKAQIEAGRKIQKDTVDWWLSQSAEAKLVTKPSNEDVHPLDALKQFSRYVSSLRTFEGFSDNSFVWSRGPNFDFPIIESLCDTFKMKPPYSTWSIRDLKTMFDVLTGGTRGQYNPKIGTPKGFLKHNALHDVCMDAVRCNDIYQEMTSE